MSYSVLIFWRSLSCVHRSSFQNRWQLWLTIALNAVVFYIVTRSDAIATAGWKGLFTAATNLLPVGFAFIVTSVANGLLWAATQPKPV
jgi:hypothetical protein